jgi:hypothetical protein
MLALICLLSCGDDRAATDTGGESGSSEDTGSLPPTDTAAAYTEP